jgi:hypothetical protein
MGAFLAQLDHISLKSVKVKKMKGGVFLVLN